MTVNPVWPFTRQVAKYGYINNPFWTTDATPTHQPCGYWHGGGDLNPVTQRSDTQYGFVNTAGSGSSYQLGFGDTDEKLIHTQVPTLIEAKKVLAGNNRTFVIDKYNRMWVVGNNQFGALGLGATITIENWTQVDGLWKDVATSADYFHTLAIKTDGTLWVTGYNNYGQLGLGDTDNRDTFEQIGSDEGWIKVACGSFYSLALNDSGDLFATGDNYGGSGLASTCNEFQLTLTDVSDMSCGYYSSLAIIAGDLKVCGSNLNGQFGNGNTSSSILWISSTSSPDNLKSVSAGSTPSHAASGFSFVITADDILYGAGRNTNHVLGLPDTSNQLEFVQIISDVKQVSGVRHSSILIKNDLSLWGTGLNQSGELGFGDKVARTEFTQVGSREWIDVSIGRSGHSVANNWDGKHYWE